MSFSPPSLALGAALVITDQATAGIMIASSIVMGRALAPIEIALGNWKQFKMMLEALRRLTGMLAANADAELAHPALELPAYPVSLREGFVYRAARVKTACGQGHLLRINSRDGSGCARRVGLRENVAGPHSCRRLEAGSRVCKPGWSAYRSMG